MKVTSQNCRSYNNKHEVLKHTFEVNQADIILLQETWERGISVPFFQGYNHYSYARHGGEGGGVSIITRDELITRRIDMDDPAESRYEYIGIEITLGRRKLRLCSLYIYHDAKEEDIFKLKDLLTKYEFDMIGGDFNLDFKTRAKKIPAKTTLMKEILSRNAYRIEKPKLFTLRNTKNRKRTVDYFIVAKGVKTTRTEVRDALIETDHREISISITPRGKQEDVKLEVPILRWDKQKHDKEEYKRLLDYFYIMNHTNGRPPSIDYEKLKRLLEFTLQMTCPRKITKKRKAANGIPFWDQELTTLLKRRNTIMKKVTTDNKLKNDFKAARNMFQRTLKDKKSLFWSKVNCKKDVENLHKIMKSRKNGLKKFAVTENNEVLQDSDILKGLTKLFSNIANADNSADMSKIKKREPITDPDLLLLMNARISREEINEELNCLNENKAPGYDDIEVFMLKRGEEASMRILLNLFNKFWGNGRYPKGWNIAMIIPVPKLKKTSLDISQFRPIALLPVIGKMMERIITRRLTRIFEESGLLPKSQYGFRKERSTIENLTILHSNAHKAIVNKKIMACVFVDLSKAYDRVNLQAMKHMLRQTGISGRMLVFMENFLSNRRAMIRWKNKKSDLFDLKNGLPQGSSLSPLLFNIYTAPILEKHDNMVAYADDTIIYEEGKTTKEIEKKLNKQLNTINNDIVNLGLAISVEKTKVMLFTRKRKYEEIKLRIGKTKIERVKNQVYLGVNFDEKLKFDEQIKGNIAKARKSFGFFQMFTHKVSGCEMNTMIKIYKSHIRSVLEYGSMIWGTTTKSRLKKIESVQHWCLTRTLGIPISAEKQDVREYCNVMSMEDRRTYLTLKYTKKKNVRLMDSVSRLINPTGADRRLLFMRRRAKTTIGENIDGTRRKLGIGWEDLKTTSDSNIKKRIKALAKRRWNARSRTNNHSKMYKILMDMKSGLKEFTSVCEGWNTRKHYSRVNQAIFGLLPLRKYLWKIRKCKKKICVFCRGEETTLHVLFSCKGYTDLRLLHFGVKQIKNPRTVARTLLGARGKDTVWKFVDKVMKRRGEKIRTERTEKKTIQRIEEDRPKRMRLFKKRIESRARRGSSSATGNEVEDWPKSSDAVAL